MFWAYLLIYLPIAIFVTAFLYETYLSFARLKNVKAGRTGYISATWEITHTLLVFAVVMTFMLFTGSLDELSTAIFVSIFVAAIALGLRAALYIYIFYVRRSQQTSWIDWLFALAHLAAASSLVVTVVQITYFLFTKHPVANLEFIPAFLPGLVLVLIIGALPLITIYASKNDGY